MRPDVAKIAHTAGDAFAERASALEPTPEEADEEFQRTKWYQEIALPLGGVIGVGLVLVLGHRRRGRASKR